MDLHYIAILFLENCALHLLHLFQLGLGKIVHLVKQKFVLVAEVYMTVGSAVKKFNSLPRLSVFIDVLVVFPENLWFGVHIDHNYIFGLDQSDHPQRWIVLSLMEMPQSFANLSEFQRIIFALLRQLERNIHNLHLRLLLGQHPLLEWQRFVLLQHVVDGPGFVSGLRMVPQSKLSDLLKLLSSVQIESRNPR